MAPHLTGLPTHASRFRGAIFPVSRQIWIGLLSAVRDALRPSLKAVDGASRSGEYPYDKTISTIHCGHLAHSLSRHDVRRTGPSPALFNARHNIHCLRRRAES